MLKEAIKSLSFYSILFFSLLLIIGGCPNRPSKDHSLKRTIGQEGEARGQFREPIGIAIDNEGFIYVSDSGNNRIHKFSPRGKFITMWGKKGKEAGDRM